MLVFTTYCYVGSGDVEKRWQSLTESIARLTLVCPESDCRVGESRGNWEKKAEPSLGWGDGVFFLFLEVTVRQLKHRHILLRHSTLTNHLFRDNLTEKGLSTIWEAWWRTLLLVLKTWTLPGGLYLISLQSSDICMILTLEVDKSSRLENWNFLLIIRLAVFAFRQSCKFLRGKNFSVRCVSSIPRKLWDW